MIRSWRLSFLILPSLIGLLIICFSIPLWVASFKDEKEVEIETHRDIWSVIQKATSTLLLLNSSATNLAKLVATSLGKTDVSFAQIQSKVPPLLFEALVTIPQVSESSYIRKDGLFFALYSQSNQQIFAVYSNTSFSEFNHLWYTRHVDSDTGNLFGEATVFPATINRTLLQQALNSTNGFALLGNSLIFDENPIVLNTASVDKIGVVALGFELKTLLNVFSGIKTFGGHLYMATKDGKVVSDGIPSTRVVLEENATISFQILKANGDRITLQLNYEMPKPHVFDISGRKYVLYASSLDIMGIQMVYVLALPYDVQSRMHKHIVLVIILLSVVIVMVTISVAITVKLARKTVCLRAAAQQLERKSNIRSLAFETASHDIRASLAAISGSIDMSINEVHQGSELATTLRVVEASTKDLQGLLNSILDTSKIEAGKMVLEEKPFDLVKALEGLVDLFYPVGLKKGVDVILDLQHDLLTKFSQVNGDERRLKQILANLLSNAIKFTSEGHISVRVRARAMNANLRNLPIAFSHYRWQSCFGSESNEKCDDFEDNNEANHEGTCMEFVFEVDDTGKGIPKEKQTSIFENYVQVNKSEHEVEGTGLGLAIVQSLVRLMGGEIRIVDKEAGEKGTCFRFNVAFKVLQSELHVLSEDENPSSKPNSHNSSTVVLLVTGDERRKMTQKFLQARGIRVLAAKDVGELAETLKELKQEPDKPCSLRSYLNLSFREVVPAQMNDQAGLSGFTLLVIDTTLADFGELPKVVAEFRKDSEDVGSRVVWLGYRFNMQVHGLDEKELPPSDIIIPMPLHGSRLNSLTDLLPEFKQQFPRSPPHGNQPSPGHSEIQEITPISPSGGSPLRGKKVLLVEDDTIQQMIAKRVLVKMGVTVDTCNNGKDALTLVSKGLTVQKDLGASHTLPFDYILMDCMMPLMDGCEATRQIRVMEKEYGVRTPIVGLTAHAEGEELNKFLSEVDVHVSKPLSEHKLLKVIKDLHSRR